MQERLYSAINSRDMNALEKRLKAEGFSASIIEAVIWRFRNVAGLC
jgi:SOS response regulatory protein OraA/RecX